MTCVKSVTPPLLMSHTVRYASASPVGPGPQRGDPRRARGDDGWLDYLIATGLATIGVATATP